MNKHTCHFNLCHKHTNLLHEILKCCVMVFGFSALLFSMHLGELVSLGGLSPSAQVLGVSTQIAPPKIDLEYMLLNSLFNKILIILKP